jgi:glycosyltransferase involved in cell wall biosynthesis
MRRLAEELVARRGWEVEVFTTGAHSAGTWDDVEPAGSSSLHGVAVHRFHSHSRRDPRWDDINEVAERSPGGLARPSQREYFEYQGPVNPGVLDAAAASSNDLVAFAPYLFWPTVAGVPRLGDRAVLHSCAHDETPLHIGLMQSVFTSAAGLCFLSEAEASLVAGLFPVADKPQVVLGGGIDQPPPEVDTGARARFGLEDRPYVVCLGRVENGKGARLLDIAFRRYKDRRPGDLALVYVGPALERLHLHPDIVVTDSVPDVEKWDLLRGAQVLVSPSAMESFSFVVLEGWQAGLPALVNAACGPTVEHCRQGQGGLWFDGYATFETALDHLLADAALRNELAASGAAYAADRFGWGRIVDRYARFCEAVLRHRGASVRSPA